MLFKPWMFCLSNHDMNMITVVTVQPEDDRKLLLLTGAGALALAVLGALCALRYYTRGRRSS